MAQVYTFTDSNGEVRLAAEINPAPGGGPAAGSYLATAGAGGTLDTSSYDDAITGVGKYKTLVLPIEDAVIAAAILGDAFPRVLLSVDPTNYGFMFDDGAHDPAGSHGASIQITATAFTLTPGQGRTELSVGSKPVRVGTPTDPAHAAQIASVSPYLTKVSGALATVQLVSGAGTQILGAGGGDAETITPCTFNPGAATTATVTVALSPDNLTYSTLGVETEPAGVAFDGTIHLVKVRVPAGWYLKLTVNAQAVLGLTTYY